MGNLQKVTKTTLSSKKARQEALKLQIQKIDDELKSIGVHDLEFRCKAAITNPETNQNTFNISGIQDVSFAVRTLAYYQNILDTYKLLDKDFTFPKGFLPKNSNNLLIQDIVFDLKLKISLLLNSDKIKVLTEAKAKLLPFLDEESRFTNALVEIDKLLTTLK
jgi:hypothetical protein